MKASLLTATASSKCEQGMLNIDDISAENGYVHKRATQGQRIEKAQADKHHEKQVTAKYSRREHSQCSRNLSGARAYTK